MERFPGRPIIQLPQSIHFSNESAVADTARTIKKHGAFTLLVRDRVSFEFARSHFDCQVHLCPDMAFSMGRSRRRPPSADLLCLLRTDKERKSVSHGPVPASAIVTDWLKETRGQRRGTKWRAFAHAALAGGGAAARRQARYNALAWGRYRRGVRILSQGKVVITDRLHAHIISTLLGIPHVVLDNSYGKLSSFLAAWTDEFEGVRRADTMGEAIAQAREFLACRP
jgi:pyruvyl transferase EpsO